jgi:hypothetical protein
VSSQAVLTAASPELTIEAAPSGEEIIALQVNPTEDYFGEADASPGLFSHPFRSQTLSTNDEYGDANGLFSMLRTHILDPIRFSSSLKFNLELWHWDDSAQVTFDDVAYFYLAASATDNLPLPTAQDFRLSPFDQ